MRGKQTSPRRPLRSSLSRYHTALGTTLCASSPILDDTCVCSELCQVRPAERQVWRLCGYKWLSVPRISVCCEQVGWPKRKLTKLETALKGSYLVSAMLRRELRADATIASEQLIGLIRCTSDRVFNATIWDVLVSPEFQVGMRLFVVSSNIVP